MKLAIAPAFVRAGETAGGPVRVLLVLDQMEELWTDRRLDAATRENFLESLEALAGDGGLGVLATLRSDFYPQAQSSAAFLRMKGERGHFDLAPPGPAALQRLIAEPARLAGLQFERSERTGKSLDQVILADAAKDPAALPLLQYALLELYERRDETRRLLTFAAYEALGGVEGALARRAAETFEALPEEAREALEEVLPLLVSVDTAGEQNAVRRRAPLDDLTGTPAKRNLVEALIAARFLTTDEESGTAIASLAHEALLRRWDRISSWINTNRDLLRMRARVEQYQAMWEESGKDASRLLPEGLALEEGRRLVEDGGHVLDDRTREFIRLSADFHEERKRRAARRRRLAFVVLSGLTVLALVGLAVGWMQAGRATREAAKVNLANEANERNLHEASMADYMTADQRIEKDGNWHEGVAYLARALQREPTNDLAASRLYLTLAMSAPAKQSLPLRVWEHGFYLDGVPTFSEDGATVTINFESETALGPSWEVDGGEAITTVSRIVDSKGGIVGACADRTRILTRDYKTSSAKLWDSTTGSLIAEFPSLDASVVISTDGRRVITSSEAKTLQVWNAITQQTLGKLTPSDQHEFVIIKLNPDGDRVVTVSSRDASESSPSICQVWDANTGQVKGQFDVRWADGRSRSPSFNSDGSRFMIVCGSAVYVADTVTGELVGGPYSEKYSEFYSSHHIDRFSPDGQNFVTAEDEKTAKLYSARDGREMLTFSHDTRLVATDFSPDGSRLVTFSESADTSDTYYARLWDVSKEGEIGKSIVLSNGDGRLDNSAWIRLVFSPDGSRFVTSESMAAQVWDSVTGKPVGAPMRHDDLVITARFSPDGLRLLTGGWDKTARIWNATTGEAITEPLFHEGRVMEARFSKDGGRVVTISFGIHGSQPRNAFRTTVWEPVPIEAKWEPRRIGNGQIGSVRNFLSPDESVAFSEVLSDTTPYRGQLWNTATGYDLGGCIVSPPEWPPFFSVEFAPKGRQAAAIAHRGVLILDTKKGGIVSVFDSPEGEKSDGYSLRAKLSPDGERLLTWRYNSVTLWDVAKKKPIAKLVHPAQKPSDATIRDANFSHDGKLIATASDDGTARIWEVATGRALATLTKHGGSDGISSIAFNSRGDRLVTTWRERINDEESSHCYSLWDVTSWKPVCEPLRCNASSYSNAAEDTQFSPDGLRLVTYGTDKTIRIWNALTGESVGDVIELDSEVHEVAFSPDGNRVATRSGARVVRLWDSNSGKPVSDSLWTKGFYEGAGIRQVGGGFLQTGNGNCLHFLPVDFRAPTPVPEWMLRRAFAIAGLEATVDGKLRSLPTEERWAILREYVPDHDRWGSLARWLAMPAAEQPLVPDSKLNRRQVAERERDHGSKESLESALVYDSTVPLAHVLLAGMLVRENAARSAEAQDPGVPKRAGLLREHGLKLIPDDARLWERAVASLVEQEDYPRALHAADKTLSLERGNIAALRATAKSLNRLDRGEEALAAYRELVETGGSEVSDFTDPAYLAAKLDKKSEANHFLNAGSEKVPQSDVFARMEGWARIGLHENEAALRAFRRAEALIEGGQKPGTDLLSGLAIAQWLNGKRDEAIVTYRQLIETGRAQKTPTDWADPKKIIDLKWPEAEIKPLEEIRAATLAKHPELAPKNPSN